MINEIPIVVVLKRNAAGFKRYFFFLNGMQQIIPTKYQVGRKLIALYKVAYGEEPNNTLEVPVTREDAMKLLPSKTGHVIIDRYIKVLEAQASK